MKKWGIFLAAAFFAALLFVLPAEAAEARSLPMTLTPDAARVHDGNLINAGSFNKDVTVKVSCEEEIAALYFRFDTETVPFVLILDGEEKAVEPHFLHQYVSLAELFGKTAREVEMRFSDRAVLNEMFALSAGDLPDFVQVWQEPCERADLMLCTTHADDEQLFFAGVLPTYAGERKLEVQVVYFTDHIAETDRRHELLNGLWTAGVRHYPVIGFVPDAFAGDGASVDAVYETALSNAGRAGFSYETIVGFQTEMLRRFQPLVVIGHDLNGEYHHGQHVLNARTLVTAVENAGKEDFYPESARQYGVWDVKKLYLHSYAENPVVMDWDVPLDAFGGKTAFQVTQEGFRCHDSQQDTWFSSWIYGTNGSVTKASEISYVPPRYASYTSDAFSPCHYGLYRSLVGADEQKNDFMEHLESRAEEAKRLEEEARQEEERKAEAARREAQRKAEEEAEKARKEAEELEKEKNRRSASSAASAQTREVVIIVVSLAVILFVALILFLRRRGKKSRRRNGRDGRLFDD